MRKDIDEAVHAFAIKGAGEINCFVHAALAIDYVLRWLTPEERVRLIHEAMIAWNIPQPKQE